MPAGHDGPRGADVFDHVRGMDLRARFPRGGDGARSGGGEAPRAASFPGTLQESPPTEGAQFVAAGEGYDLNFENTPVSSVAKVILGDILSVGYTIDPRVQGTVSLSSGRPVNKNDLLFVLESVLRMSNVALVRDGAGYKLVPAGEAVGTGRVDAARGRQPEAGYGVTVLPLRHVSVATISRLIEGFATKPGTIRADTARNMVLIQGSGVERRSAIDTLLSFDVDWMRGQSVGVYPVRNASPETVISELEKIMESGEGGLGQNMVKFQPVARLNAILVVTRRPEMLRTASTWISRLDRADTASSGVKVYRVRYGDARQLAAILNDIFTGQGGSGLDSATNQVAPGAGVSAVSSGGSPTLDGQQSTMTAGAKPGQGGVGSFDSRFGTTTPGATRGGAVAAAAAIPRSGGVGGPAVLQGVRITPDVANNALLIYASRENYRIIERTLNEIDRPQLQVAIDATIAEITLNNELRYGVQYFLKSSDVGLGTDKGSTGLHNGLASAIINRALPGFNLLVGPEGDPRFILDALRGITQVKVLSSPSVVVLDNQVAHLLVGDQVPIATRTATLIESSNTPIVNNIDYRNTGVILRVVPRVNVNGNVILDVEQEISNVPQTAGNTGTLTPTVSQRKIKSSIAVASGQTVLLAGLISDRQEKGRSGIPLLEQIEVLGEAFSRNSSSSVRTELILVIRPQIIRDGLDAQKVAEELRSKMRGSADAMRTTPLQRAVR